MEIPSNAADLIADLTLDEVMDVIEEMESGGDVNAIGDLGKAYGCLQIQAGCLEDFKRWNPDGDTKALALHDLQGDAGRLISRKIFTDYMQHYATKKRLGRAVTYEDMARIWNGGPNGWNKSATRGYGAKFVRLAFIKASQQRHLV